MWWHHQSGLHWWVSFRCNHLAQWHQAKWISLLTFLSVGTGVSHSPVLVEESENFFHLCRRRSGVALPQFVKRIIFRNIQGSHTIHNLAVISHNQTNTRLSRLETKEILDLQNLVFGLSWSLPVDLQSSSKVPSQLSFLLYRFRNTSVPNNFRHLLWHFAVFFRC